MGAFMTPTRAMAALKIDQPGEEPFGSGGDFRREAASGRGR